jgi:hypothetical protein
MPQGGRKGGKLSCDPSDKKSVLAGKARRNSSKLTVQCANLYENKGLVWKVRLRSWNVHENKGT